MRMLFSILIQSQPMAQSMTDVFHQEKPCPVWHRGCPTVGFVVSLKRQDENSKPELGLPLQKIPCITLILQSVITLY